MRHDARTRLQLDEFGLQLADQVGQQVQRHHARFREIGEQDVALDEFHTVGDSCVARVFARDLHQLAVELDAKPARTVLASGGDDDAAVARTEIHDQIVRARAGECEHALHHFIGRGDERHAPRRVLREGRYGDGEEQEKAQHEENSSQKKARPEPGLVDGASLISWLRRSSPCLWTRTSCRSWTWSTCSTWLSSRSWWTTSCPSCRPSSRPGPGTTGWSWSTGQTP